MVIADYDAEELAAKLLGFSEDYEPDDVEQKLWDVYEISMNSFHRLISDLAPMCEVGQSPITGEKFRGFADVASQCWIARVDACKVCVCCKTAYANGTDNAEIIEKMGVCENCITYI